MGIISLSTSVRRDDLAVLGTARGYSVTMSQSKKSGGLENTLKPMEFLLAALGGCITMVAVTRSDNEGIDLRNIRLEMDGEYSAADGFRTISLKVRVESVESQERLDEFFSAVEHACPVSNSLKGKIELEVMIE